MKKKNILLIGFAFLMIAMGCEKDPVIDDSNVRLFRPVSGGTLVADSNAILASFLQIQGATSYTLQVSRDTFKTIDVTINVTDTGMVLVKDLKWDQLYQVQVKANAADPSLSSKYSYLGAIKTPKFPTILNTPGSSEVTEAAVKVSWTNSGAAVTSVKILKASDSSVVTTVLLTPGDITSQFKIITGLASSTSYIIFLYSGTTVRGWTNFSTKASLSGNLIDLRGFSGRPSVLADTIPLIPSGSTIILKRGENYTISSALNLSKTVNIISGSDLAVPGQAIINLPSNFNIVSGSVIDSIVFNDVTLKSTDATAKYVFNINAVCTINKINFIGCRISTLRGIVRLQTQPAIVNNFLVDNCVIDSLGSYGVLTVDVNTSKADNITIRNSTIYKAEKIIVSKNNSTSLTLESCTINEAPLGGGSSYFIDYNTSPTNNVVNGIAINNCIFGVAKMTGANLSVRGVRAGATTSINTSNNYRTSDYVSAGNDIPNIITYTRPSTQIWQDPFNGNFKIIDVTFPGRSNSGDPRWRL